MNFMVDHQFPIFSPYFQMAMSWYHEIQHGSARCYTLPTRSFAHETCLPCWRRCPRCHHLTTWITSRYPVGSSAAATWVTCDQEFYATSCVFGHLQVMFGLKRHYIVRIYIYILCTICVCMYVYIYIYISERDGTCAVALRFSVSGLSCGKKNMRISSKKHFLTSVHVCIILRPCIGCWAS